jgi:Ca-activated chloride channel family protein
MLSHGNERCLLDVVSPPSSDLLDLKFLEPEGRGIMRRSKNYSARIYKALIGCLLLLASQPGVRGQQQSPGNDQDNNIIRQRTSLVVVNVSVTDKRFRQISGLNKEHFEIYEDKVRQQIEFFSDDDKPASVGVIFDLSGSMNDKISRAREAIKAFISTSHDQDDFFLVGFNERARLLAEISDGQSVLDKLALAEPHGQTALYDATYLGVEKVKEGRHDKRAILIVSDGQDNASRYNYGELRKLLKEADVQVYCIGITEAGAGAGSTLDRQGQIVLEEIAHTTGGMAFFPASYAEMEDSVTRIAITLRRQYSIGYVPLNEHRDGKWRKIKVRVNAPKGLPSLMVRAKEGYYATP